MMKLALQHVPINVSGDGGGQNETEDDEEDSGELVRRVSQLEVKLKQKYHLTMYNNTELSVLVLKQAITPMTIIEVPVINNSVGKEKFNSGTILKI